LSYLVIHRKKDDEATGYYFECMIDGEEFAITDHMSDIDGTVANIGGLQVNPNKGKTSTMNLYTMDLENVGAAEYTDKQL
jgi:hypothetical protein